MDHRPVFDFHTHDLSTPPGSGIVCLPREIIEDPSLFTPAKGGLYAAGIHPWWTAPSDEIAEKTAPSSDALTSGGLPAYLEHLLDGLESLLEHEEIVMIGECGFDALRGGDMALQRAVFDRQVALSESLGIPMTIHCVRAWDRLLAARRDHRPSYTWTVHGFRGKPALARQLLAAGFDLSFGFLRNAESWDITPSSRRHEETDSE